MRNLERLGLRNILDQRVLSDRIPVLGICLGMQLITRSSGEGLRPGLGWIAGDTLHLRKGEEAVSQTMKFPHIGWNYVSPAKPHRLVASLPDEPRFYFVHSYKVVCDDPGDILLHSNYRTISFTAAFARDNIVGVQFHPEKSHRFGMQLLSSFAKW